MRAAEGGHVAAVGELLKAGADPNKAGLSRTFDLGAKSGLRDTRSPMNELMMAASGGYTDLVRLLLNAGADINEQSSYGTTALHCAVCSGRAEVVEVLLQAGASPKLRDNEGKTSLQSGRQIITAWTGKNRHPIVGELPNLAGYRLCLKLLEEAEKQV